MSDRATGRERWWESCAAIARPYLKAGGVTLADLTARLGALQALGFDAVEVFAPCAGGSCYHGLDTIDFYRVDPAIGTLDDFRTLVRAAHERGMAVVAFLNLGYTHEQFPAFLQACDDVRSGRDSPERRWFVWSETGRDTMDRSLAPFFMNDSHGRWHLSERAGRFFWVKWEGEQGGFHLPQLNYADPGWQAEARKILAFWLDTEIDGVVVDAVNWYVGCDWAIARATLTDPVRAAGSLLAQPEGAGGFGDDPVPWVTQGGFNCVQDYSLKIWWEGRDLIADAIASGDPRPIEAALRTYRDRVVAAGGVCYLNPAERPYAASLDERLLNAATVATVGQLFIETGDLGDADEPYRRGVGRLLDARRRYPALCAGGARTSVAADDDACLAFVREARGQTPVLVMLNFARATREVTLDLGALRPRLLREIWSGDERPGAAQVTITLPGLGHALYELRF